MVKQNRSSGNKKPTQQNIPLDNSSGIIANTIDTVDAGDDVQLRFRYQHAYGVILLLAALSSKKPYTVLWCEHHEDLLGEKPDGLFDAYQIKTRADGLWNLTDDPLKDSIKRFVEVDQRFPNKIQEFFFVSNAHYEDSRAQSKIERNPKKFLQAIKQATSPIDLPTPFITTFENLRSHCQCEPLNLLAVLKKLDLLTGPALDSFEPVIAQDHLSNLPDCHDLPATALSQLRDALIAKVSKASSLGTNDPARHWYGLTQNDYTNPILQVKRIEIENILPFIQENRFRLLSLTKNTAILSARHKETLNLYLDHSFQEDQVSKLDQAGETDPDRITLLHQVFIDLELKSLHDQPLLPRHLEQNQFPLFPESEQQLEITSSDEKKPLSAMDCFLKESFPKIVIIGGPGQGKSTLGQYLAQVHRAILLNYEQKLYRDTSGTSEPQNKFRPKEVRLPFRIVLKYFAQWLEDRPKLDTVEAYIAEEINKGASRPEEINAPTVQEILKAHPTLLIFDGLDEVTDQALCNRMLQSIEHFLARAERLEVNMQIIATSRPTGYRDQFTPKLFWHLELQPLSVEKIKEYATRWTDLKEPNSNEKRRIHETLEECLKESHTRPLLNTPLQVTIILLIIKDGGRPPSQREELFQQYWTTILRREKSKAKGMIRTGDTLLFNLHAYLGYLLHRNALGGNVRSLFPASEFEQIIFNFLQSTDNVSPPQEIQKQVANIIEDAKNRLVLLVEPESGFFGFELRSLQEFFAGAYLVQTARNTQQRFDRLKAIAYSEHWRNVFLFCSGRIVRDFSGEAALILEDVCRPMDRNPPDTYLHRGAWLALDIAADGIFTTNNRNLQYSALEHALTILNTGMTDERKINLTTISQRLPSQDQRDILSKILKQKLPSLPLSCLPTALEILGHFIEPPQDLIGYLKVLLLTDKQEYILQALNIGFQHAINPQWLAQQLEKYWPFWTNEQARFSLQRWWQEHQRHTQIVLLALSLSEEQASNLIDLLSLTTYRSHSKGYDLSLLENPTTYSEQLIIFLQCSYIIDNYLYPSSLGPIIKMNISKSLTLHQDYVETHKNTFVEIFKNSEFSVTLNQLIERADLIPQLRAYLWILYWQTHEPTKTIIATLLTESKTWSKNPSLTDFLQARDRFWPLPTLIWESQMNDDQYAATLIEFYLNSFEEISFSQQMRTALQKGFARLSDDEQFITILCDRYTGDYFSELISLAEKHGVDSNKLINKYTMLSMSGNFKLSSVILQGIFSNIENSIIQSQEPQIQWWVLLASNWILNQEAMSQGVQLLHMLSTRLPQKPTILKDTIILFLKLLSFDTTPLLDTPAILSSLVDETLLKEIPISPLNNFLFSIPEEHLIFLADFTINEDAKIQQGALILWVYLLERTYFIPRGPMPKLKKVLSFDWKLCLSLIKDTDIAQRKRGIVLLTYSHFPIKESQQSETLQSAMAQAQGSDEISAWTQFLGNVPVSRSEKKAWQKLLETILDAPQSYSPQILTAAMERYTELEGVAGPEIKDERALELPILPLPKKIRGKK